MFRLFQYAASVLAYDSEEIDVTTTSGDVSSYDVTSVDAAGTAKFTSEPLNFNFRASGNKEVVVRTHDLESHVATTTFSVSVSLRPSRSVSACLGHSPPVAVSLRRSRSVYARLGQSPPVSLSRRPSRSVSASLG